MTTDAIKELPAAAEPAARIRVEEALVGKAALYDARQLLRFARRALELVEAQQDQVEAHEDELLGDEEACALAKTRLTLHDNDDGTVSGHFTVPALAGAILRKVLDAMTAPRRGRLGAPDGQAGASGFRTDWAHERGLASPSSSSICRPTTRTARWRPPRSLSSMRRSCEAR